MSKANKKFDKSVKITVVGDGAVGKTCILVMYTTKVFPKEHVPTIFENYVEYLELGGVKYQVKLWDTAGQEDYEGLMPLCYTDTTCFLICYSISSRDSYENVLTKWWPSVRDQMPTTPIILVGTKSDLRTNGDPNKQMVTEKDGLEMRTMIKAIDYMECSALLNKGLKDIIHAAVRAGRKSRFCTLL